MQKTTSFGFKTVPAAEKASMVGEVFSDVASNYDIMNDVMSFGIHRLWKDELIKMMQAPKGAKLLDVAGGTGDIARRFLDAVPEAQVTLCDINFAMMQAGQLSSLDKGYLKGLDYVCGNAETLPVPDDHFDFYTIGFGIRNVTDKDKALKEAYRALKPGGRFFCLEFSPVEKPLLKTMYDTFSFHVIPQMGQIFAKNKDAYRYLVESIRVFPTPEAFAAMVEQAGFTQVKHRQLSGGIVSIHSGWKI